MPTAGSPLTRAYSLLTVKAVDEDERLISGTASSPVIDRVGDIIEADGLQYRAALPFLLYHDSSRPAGEITLKRTGEATKFSLRIPKVAEPGIFRDRTDEAWHTLKYLGRVMGTSIGFRALEPPARIPTGYRFTKAEVVEVSLVSVPANADATIDVVRSLDTAYRAALGAGGGVPASSLPSASGAPRIPRESLSMLNISDQLTAAKNGLREKHARLQELLTAEGGAGLDRAQTDEADSVAAEVKSLTAHIVRLEAAEAAQAALATPISRTQATVAPAPTSATQPVARVEVRDNQPPGNTFVRMAICKMGAYHHHESALSIAKSWFPFDQRLQMELKAAVTAGTTTDSTWAGPLVEAQTSMSEFIEWLRPQTLVGRVPGLSRVPFNTRIVSQTSGGSAAWVGEGKLKPVTKFDFDAITLGFAKLSAIAVISDELARFSRPGAEDIVRRALRDAIVERLDIDFIDPNHAATPNVSPASITNGIAALVSSGSDADAVRADLEQLLGTFIDANISPTQLVVITSATVALRLSLLRNALGQREFPEVTMTGGTLQGLPLIPTQYAAIGSPAAHLVAVVNAPDIFLADDGQVTVDASNQASIEMSSDPENESGTVVSMYQSNQMALRAERFINWARGRASAVAHMDDVTWGAGS